ncbi:MAG: carboxymuconolactone decarboxylase family protein, partial [Herbaspirillum sp.]
MSAARLPYWELAPKAFEKMLSLSDTVHKSSLGPILLDLVFLRASQINGCAFCVDMHTRDLLKHGED